VCLLRGTDWVFKYNSVQIHASYAALPKINSKISATTQPSRLDQNFAIMLPSKPKTTQTLSPFPCCPPNPKQPKHSAPSPAVLQTQNNSNTQPLPLLHFPTRYLLHFPTIYLVSSIPSPEKGRTGTARKPTEQQNFLTSTPIMKNAVPLTAPPPFLLKPPPLPLCSLQRVQQAQQVQQAQRP